MSAPTRQPATRGTRDDGQAGPEHQHPAGLAQAEVRLHYGHSNQPEEDSDNDDQPEGFHERHHDEHPDRSECLGDAITGARHRPRQTTRKLL